MIAALYRHLLIRPSVYFIFASSVIFKVFNFKESGKVRMQHRHALNLYLLVEGVVLEPVIMIESPLSALAYKS